MTFRFSFVQSEAMFDSRIWEKCETTVNEQIPLGRVSVACARGTNELVSERQSLPLRKPAANDVVRRITPLFVASGKEAVVGQCGVDVNAPDVAAA